MASTSDLGKVSIVPKGDYNPAIQYERLDVVGSNGSAYIALKDNIGHPVSDVIYWYKLVHAGTGITEITGPVSSGLSDTYTVHYSDGSTTSFSIRNGKGIERIDPPETPGVHGEFDTYTILYNDGTSSTFIVGNGYDGDDGNGIEEITGPETSGLLDIYTIHFSNGSTTTFSVENGRGITRIDPPETPGVHGQTDTYTIIYNDGTSSTFIVGNGTDGESGGVQSVDGISSRSGQGDIELMMVGRGAPTPSTSAKYKQRYLDADSGLLYVCLTQTGTTYNWITVGTSVKVENEILKFKI